MQEVSDTREEDLEFAPCHRTVVIWSFFFFSFSIVVQPTVNTHRYELLMSNYNKRLMNTINIHNLEAGISQFGALLL